MPFPKDVVSQLDYNSRLRLTICFFRTKSMLKGDCDDDEPLAITAGAGGGVEEEASLGNFEDGEGNERLALCKAKPHPSLFPMGMLQELMCEVWFDADIFFLLLSVSSLSLSLSLSLPLSLSLSLPLSLSLSLGVLPLSNCYLPILKCVCVCEKLQ